MTVTALFERVNVTDASLPLRRHHLGAQLGHLPVLLAIEIVLIGKTAEQAATDAADLVGV